MEDSRERMSLELRDEIAQTLLGINVRLLTLKQQVAMNAESIRRDIADTQKLVEESVKSITRFARQIRKHHET